jgi:hypothetical protein
MQRQVSFSIGAAAFGLIAALAACGGGGGSGYGGGNPPPVATTPPATQQVIRIAIPTSAIGTIDSQFGVIGGYTESSTSQILGFAPGTKVMLENAQSTSSGIPHTLGDTGGNGSFPASGSNLSMTANTMGGKFRSGFQTGTLQPGTMIGPITLEQGTYFIGCAYHYSTNGMRDVLIVAANATPGPAATPPPGQSPPPSGGGYGP